MNDTHWIYIIVSLLFLGLGGCIDAFDLEFGELNPDRKLVVEGRIHMGKGPYRVRLEWIDELGLGKVNPILGASICLMSDRGESEIAWEEGEGVYLFPGENIQGKEGISYWIELDIEGTKYASHPETMPPQVPMDQLKFREYRKEVLTSSNVIAEKKYVELDLTTSLPNWMQGPYLRWESEETYTTNDMRNDELIICYYTLPLNPQKIQLFDGTSFQNATYTQFQVVDREIDWTFNLRHVFSVYQFSLTREAFQYWRRLEEVIEQNGSIFDLPPAIVLGNMRNIAEPTEQVLGYFEAVAIDTIHLSTFVSDFSYRSVPRRCPFNPSGYRPPQCNPCWEHEQVFFDRPPFFDN